MFLPNSGSRGSSVERLVNSHVHTRLLWIGRARCVVCYSGTRTPYGSTSVRNVRGTSIQHVLFPPLAIDCIPSSPQSRSRSTEHFPGLQVSPDHHEPVTSSHKRAGKTTSPHCIRHSYGVYSYSKYVRMYFCNVQVDTIPVPCRLQLHCFVKLWPKVET